MTDTALWQVKHSSSKQLVVAVLGLIVITASDVRDAAKGQQRLLRSESIQHAR